MPRSGWHWPAVELLAGAGIVDSIYLTVVHYSGAPLACVNTGILNCDLVTRSSFGVVPGTAISVGFGGIFWFAVVLVLALAAQSMPHRPVAVSLLAWSAIGAIVVLYLIYVELVRLNRVCEWCTLVHGAVIAILLLSLAIVQGALAERRDA